MKAEQRDVFICHASEDKEGVVRPLVQDFEAAGISVWFDEAEIHWGDTVTGKINTGMQISRYVLVVVSRQFVQKKWTTKELHTALHQEVSSGETKVLPLLVGSKGDVAWILEQIPMIAEKRYLEWNGNSAEIVVALQRRLGHKARTPSPAPEEPDFDIPLPKHAVTQLEKDTFLEHAFDHIKGFFSKAAMKVSTSSPGLKVTFKEITSTKFLCRIYNNGDLAQACSLRLGGPIGQNSISFCIGQRIEDSDNSANDWVTVTEGKSGLGLKAGNFGFHAHDFKDKESLTPTEAAHYFWKIFMDAVSHR